MKTPILMSRDNPDGAKLEELLDQLIAELNAKNNLLFETTPSAIGTPRVNVISRAVGNNNAILQMLRGCASLQRDTMAAFEQLGPDKGPTAPRV
jgi:hypothetical protein